MMCDPKDIPVNIRDVPWSIFFTEYRVPGNKAVFAESGYRVVDCLSKHAQHKFNGCRRKPTVPQPIQIIDIYIQPRLRLAIDTYK